MAQGSEAAAHAAIAALFVAPKGPSYHAPVPDELTFSDLVDYLSDHEGKNVYVQIGTHDHEGPENADLFILKLHGYRLGKVQDAVDYSSQERRGVMVWLDDAVYLSLS